MTVTKEEARVLLIKKTVEVFKSTKEDNSKALENFKAITSYVEAMEDTKVIDEYESYSILNTYFRATSNYTGTITDHKTAIRQLEAWEAEYKK